MGKNLIQQRRGRGTGAYRTPSFRFKGVAAHKRSDGNFSGTVLEFIKCPAHTAPLVRIMYDDGEEVLTIAPEGISLGDRVTVGGSEISAGTVMKLEDIPDGAVIYNIEVRPGDGGKLVRSSGTFAKVVGRSPSGVTVRLPSRKEKVFLPHCRAAVGVVAGGGRPDKPFLKASAYYFRRRMKNLVYPRVCGISMNAVNHPYGGKNSHVKGRPTVSPRNAPPGRMVGKIRASRTGRKKR